VRAILCIWAAVSPVAGWIWRLYHATEDGRLFNYSVHLSRYPASGASLAEEHSFAAPVGFRTDEVVETERR
jgi:hypothetical protein